MAWENSTQDIMLEVQEAEKLVIIGPGGGEASITSDCGAILSIACC